MITEFLKENPKLGIIILSFIISFFTSIIYKLTTNQEKMKELKKKQKELQAKIKEHRNKPEKLLEIQREMMMHSSEMMKESFKPMMFTLLPLIVIFGWLRNVFHSTPLEKSWIWWYIISGIFFNMIFKKILRIE